MIKQSTLFGVTLLLLLLNPLVATGEQHLPEDQRLFFFKKEVITIKNVCHDVELTSFEAFMPKNMFLYFKQQTNNGLVKDYNKYQLALQQHKQVMEEYLQSLTEKIETYTDDSLNNYQIDFIRAKIDRLASYVHKLLSELDDSMEDYQFYSGNDIVPLGDSFEAFKNHSSTFEDLNDAFIFNLKQLLAEASDDDLMRQALQPSVCGNIIESAIFIFQNYLNQDSFNVMAQEKKAILIRFFTEFSKHDFANFECGQNFDINAKSYLIGNIYNTIYDIDMPEISPEDFQYFLQKIIPNTPTTPSTDFDGVKKMDYDIVHAFHNFDDVSIDDLLKMYQLRRPVSTDFLEFINNAEEEMTDLNIKVNKRDEEDVPLEVFTTIYKSYIIARSTLPEDQVPLFEPLDGVVEDEDLARIAKSLYFFILQTKLFDPVSIVAEDNEEDLIPNAQFTQFMDPNTFQRYRTLALIVLARKFSLKPKELMTDYTPQLLDILDKYNDPNEFVDSGDLGDYMPDEVVEKYHNQQAKAIFDKFEIKKDDIKEKLNQMFNSKKPKDKRRPKKAVLSEVFEDIEPEIEEIVNFTSINNPKENKATLAKKTDMLVGLVEKADNDVDQFAALNIVARALQTKVVEKLPQDSKDPAIKEKKNLLVTTLAKMNNKLINDLLIKIKSPGLYQFLTYVSTQSNLNDLKVLGSLQKDSTDPDRANNFTLDKLIFLHQWHTVAKKGLVAKKQRGEQLDKQDIAISKLVGPSKHFSDNLSISYSGKTSKGFDTVYKHLLLTSMFLEYYPSLKFMAELIPLFERFSNIDHPNPSDRMHENYREVFVTLYNIILDIRSYDLEMKGRKTIDVFMEKLHQIRGELLQAHISKEQEDYVTAKYSLTYKDVARVSYFAYYHMSLELGHNVFEEQIAGNFGFNDLVKLESEMEHNRYDFGGIAFELSNFLTYIYLHDRDFIRSLCVVLNPTESESHVKLNGFCAQSMIFMNSMEFLSKSDGGDFNSWIGTVFADDIFKQYVMDNKGVFYAALEMINRESNMLRTLHSERLSKLIDDEQARTVAVANSHMEADYEPSDYDMFFTLVAADRAWLTNYMFINFERSYNVHEKSLFDAFYNIIEEDVLDDYVGPIKKVHYNDLELEAKSFNVEAFRVMLLFTQTHEHFVKIADYLMAHNRSSLLIYLKKENDNNSSIVTTLLNRVAEEEESTVDTVKEIIKNLFNQYNDLLVKKCESSILDTLNDENILDFGNLDDILGDEMTDTQNFSIEIDQTGIEQLESDRKVQEMSHLNVLKKEIGAKVNLMIDQNKGQGALVINSNFSEDDMEETQDPEIKNQVQVNRIAINDVISSMMLSANSGKDVKITTGGNPNGFEQKKKLLVKNLKSNYENMSNSSPREQTTDKSPSKNSQFELII